MELLIPLIVIGLFSGLLLGLTGGGGSVIITPLLIYFIGYSFSVSSNFAMIAIFIGALIGAILQYKNINWKVAIIFIIFGSISSLLGTKLSYLFAEKTLKIAFAILLLIITVATISKSFIKKRLVSHQDIFVTVDNKHLIKMSGIALFTGIAIGFFSVGGGFLIVPALTFFTQLKQIMIRPTSLVIIANIALINLLFKNNVLQSNFEDLIIFVIFNVIGILLGIMLDKKMKSEYIQLLFAFICLLFALFIFYSELLS